MSLTAAASGFVVLLLLTVPVVQGQDGWGVTYTSTEVCAVKGSTVNIHCTYTYPPRRYPAVQERFWFIKQSNGVYVDLTTDPEYSGRVKYNCENNRCTLTITNLRESDSAVYKFRFITNQHDGKFTGEPGVTVSVSDPQLQVHVRRSTVSQYPTLTELTCHSSCQVPDQTSYVWYKNGQEVKGEKNKYFYTYSPEDNYRCSVIMYPPVLPSVSVSPSGQIVEGSSVTLTCSSDANPAAKYTWYKTNRNLELQPLSKESLTFSSIQSSDSGDYHCTAENELGNNTSKSISIDVTSQNRRGHNSTLSLPVVEGESIMMMNIIRLTLVVLMLIPLLVVSLWTRKKKHLSLKTEPKEAGEMIELDSCPEYEDITAAQTEDTEEQEDLV